jgi:hypothetical protein
VRQAAIIRGRVKFHKLCSSIFAPLAIEPGYYLLPAKSPTGVGGNDEEPLLIAKIISVGTIFLIMLAVPGWQVQSQSSECAVGQQNIWWRFGITAPNGISGYDLASLHACGFLDWQANSNPILPAGMDYVHVLRVGDFSTPTYTTTLASLSGWVTSNPGSMWLIGNEPDHLGEGQDGINADEYAQRYFTLATQIRSLDATAKIGFGTVVQPTPIRMRYLKQAYDRLTVLAGNDANKASALIDVWSVHSFILNEQLGQWGAGIPVGFETDNADAIPITPDQFYKTHDPITFSQRITAFRTWMASIGQRDKPLWITEYGSLFPPTRLDLGVTDQNTAAFMVATFDFLLSAHDSNTGLSSDGNRLVQRWFWYSLNEHRDVFGGSLFDPDHGKTITAVGRSFICYTTHQPGCYLYIPQVHR